MVTESDATDEVIEALEDFELLLAALCVKLAHQKACGPNGGAAGHKLKLQSICAGFSSPRAVVGDGVVNRSPGA